MQSHGTLPYIQVKKTSLQESVPARCVQISMFRIQIEKRQRIYGVPSLHRPPDSQPFKVVRLLHLPRPTPFRVSTRPTSPLRHPCIAKFPLEPS